MRTINGSELAAVSGGVSATGDTCPDGYHQESYSHNQETNEGFWAGVGGFFRDILGFGGDAGAKKRTSSSTDFNGCVRNGDHREGVGEATDPTPAPPGSIPAPASSS